MASLEQQNKKDRVPFWESYKFYFLILSVLVFICILFLIIIGMHEQSYYSYIANQ